MARGIRCGVTLAVLLLAGAGCTGNRTPGRTGPTPGNGARVSDGFAIGLLLPEAGASRYQTLDRPLIEASKVDVPAVLLAPVAVTRANFNDTVVKDGFVTAAQLCPPDYAAPCAQAGISAP